MCARNAPVNPVGVASTIAQLSAGVISPTLRLTVVKDSAGVVCSQRPQRPFGPCRGRSLWMMVHWCPCCFHHRPTVRIGPTPNTSGRRCQGWRRCGNIQQTPQRPFGPYRGRSLWMKVRWCSCCFLHRPTVLIVYPPTLQVAVVKDGAGVEVPASTATAVRPVPRSIAVDEGALVSVLLPPSPNCP